MSLFFTNFYLRICDVLFQSGEVVALKKVPLRKLEDGIPNTALRYERCGKSGKFNTFVKFIIKINRIVELVFQNFTIDQN